MPDVGLILLAAGGSTRMGRPKQLMAYEGCALVRRAADVALAAGCSPIVVVTGAAADEVGAALHGVSGLLIEHNSAWAAGMGTSIRAGLARLLRQSPAVDGVIVMLCDQPHVTADHLRRLIVLHGGEVKSIVATYYSEAPGVPCFFAAEWFPALQQLPDEHGAKRVILSAGDAVATVPLAAAAVDIDMPDYYQRLIDG